MGVGNAVLKGIVENSTDNIGKEIAEKVAKEGGEKIATATSADVNKAISQARNSKKTTESLKSFIYDEAPSIDETVKNRIENIVGVNVEPTINASQTRLATMNEKKLDKYTEKATKRNWVKQNKEAIKAEDAQKKAVAAARKLEKKNQPATKWNKGIQTAAGIGVSGAVVLSMFGNKGQQSNSQLYNNQGY